MGASCHSTRSDAEQRQVAEALLDEINRLRARDTAPVGRSVNVHAVRLVTSIGVSAKRS